MHFYQNKEGIEKSTLKKNTRYQMYIYINIYIYIYIYKTCFQHDMAYGVFEDLVKRTASDKVLRNKSLNTAKNPKYGSSKMS